MEGACLKSILERARLRARQVMRALGLNLTR